MQEARLAVANADLAMAQAQLDEKEAELAAVQAEYDRAMGEKQVSSILFQWQQNLGSKNKKKKNESRQI